MSSAYQRQPDPLAKSLQLPYYSDATIRTVAASCVYHSTAPACGRHDPSPKDPDTITVLSAVGPTCSTLAKSDAIPTVWVERPVTWDADRCRQGTPLWRPSQGGQCDWEERSDEALSALRVRDCLAPLAMTCQNVVSR